MPIERSDHPTLLLDEEGPAIATTEDAADLVGLVLSRGAKVIAIPLARLDDTAFDLDTGFAEELAQTIASYRLRLVVVGDLSEYAVADDVFRTWARAVDRADRVWFVADATALERRLERAR